MALGITISTNITVDVNLRIPVQCATEPTLRYKNSVTVEQSRAKPQSGGVPSWLSLLVFVCSKMATSAQMYVHNMPRSM